MEVLTCQYLVAGDDELILRFELLSVQEYTTTTKSFGVLKTESTGSKILAPLGFPLTTYPSVSRDFTQGK